MENIEINAEVKVSSSRKMGRSGFVNDEEVIVINNDVDDEKSVGDVSEYDRSDNSLLLDDTSEHISEPDHASMHEEELLDAISTAVSIYRYVQSNMIRYNEEHDTKDAIRISWLDATVADSSERIRGVLTENFSQGRGEGSTSGLVKRTPLSSEVHDSTRSAATKRWEEFKFTHHREDKASWKFSEAWKDYYASCKAVAAIRPLPIHERVDCVFCYFRDLRTDHWLIRCAIFKALERSLRYA